MSSNQQWHRIRPSPGVPTKMVSLGPFNNFLLTYKIGRGAVLGVCCCAQAVSRCVEGRLLSSCSAWASRCSGFSRCGAWALCVWASAVVARRPTVVGLSSGWCTGLAACGMWNLLGSGIKSVSPASAGGLFTRGPPEKSLLITCFSFPNQLKLMS